MQENLKVNTNLNQVKTVSKMNDKGIDLCSCENRKGYNIFDTIGINNEPEEEGKKKYIYIYSIF